MAGKRVLPGFPVFIFFRSMIMKKYICMPFFFAVLTGLLSAKKVSVTICVYFVEKVH